MQDPSSEHWIVLFSEDFLFQLGNFTYIWLKEVKNDKKQNIFMFETKYLLLYLTLTLLSIIC